MNITRKLVFFYVLLPVIILGVVGVVTYEVRVVAPYHKVEKLQEKYATISKGMTKADIIQLMGEPTGVNGLKAVGWDDAEITPEDRKRIVDSIEYGTNTYFLPVTFVISFDSDGKAVAKHRFD